MGPSGVSSSLPTGGHRKGACPGGHRGRPLHRDGRQQANPGERAGNRSRPVAAGCGHPALRKLCWQCAASAPTKRRDGHRDRPGQRRRAERLRQRLGRASGNRSRDYPQSFHQPWTIPQSRPLAATAPFAQGSLALQGTGGYTGPPLHGHRSAQQPQAGRGRARPLRGSKSVAGGGGPPPPQKIFF